MRASTVNTHDTAALLQHRKDDYLLVSAHSARADIDRMEKTVSENIDLAVSLAMQSVRLGQRASGIKIASPIVAVMALIWYVAVDSSVISGFAVAGIVCIAGCGLIVGPLTQRRADSLGREARSIRNREVVELLGGERVGSGSVYSLSGGSALVGLRGRVMPFPGVLESFTGERRGRVVALVGEGLVGEAVGELRNLSLPLRD